MFSYGRQATIGHPRIIITAVMLARPAANWGAHPQPSGRVRSGSVATVLAAKDRPAEPLLSDLYNTRCGPLRAYPINPAAEHGHR